MAAENQGIRLGRYREFRRNADRARPSLRGRAALEALAAAILLFGAIVLPLTPQLQLLTAAAATLGFGHVGFEVTRRIAPHRVTPSLVALTGMLQAFWILSLVATGADTTALGSSLHVDLTVAPVRSVLPLAIPSVSAALVVTLLHAMTTRSRPSPIRLGMEGRRAVNRLAVLSAALMLLFWPVSDPTMTGPLAYSVRVAHSALAFAPLLVGRFASGVAERVFLGGVAVNAVLALAQSARYPAFLPLVLWSIGRVWRDWKILDWRRGAGWASLAAGVFVATGIFGVVRGEFGRSSFEDVISTGVATPFEAAGSVAASNRLGDEVLHTTLSRLVTWANPVVFALTPEVVPYRGPSGLVDQVKDLAAVARIRGQTREDVLDRGAGTAPAREFGFMVTAKTSVEFPALADGWSRAGAFGGALTCVLWTLWVLGLEGVARRIMERGRFVGLMLWILSLKAALDPSAVPLLAGIRGSVLHGFVVVVVGLALGGIRGDRLRPLSRGSIGLGVKDVE